MKRGTLLLILTLALQGSTSFAVLGDGNNPHELTKGQKRAARAARRALRRAQEVQQAAEVAQALAAAEAKDTAAAVSAARAERKPDPCFVEVFGPQPKPTDYDSDDNGKNEEDPPPSAMQTADEKVSAWSRLGEIFAGAGAPTTEELAAQKDAQEAAAAAELKAQQKETADAFVGWQKTPGVRQVVTDIPAAAQQMQRGSATKQTTRTALQTVLKPLAEAALDAKERKARELFANVLTDIESYPKTPSFDEALEAFDIATRRPTVSQKTHNAVWKAATNPSDPKVLIGLLSKEHVADDEAAAYTHYLEQAIQRLATLFKQNHALRPSAQTVSARTQICATNKELSWTLMKLLALAGEQDLAVSNRSKETIVSLVAANDEAIAELESAQQIQRAQLESTQNAQLAALRGAHTPSDVADRLGQLSLCARIRILRSIKARSFQSGLHKAPNLAQAIEISQALATGLKDGTVNLNDAALFLNAVQEKNIPVDVGTLRELKDAIAEIQAANEATASAQAQENKAAADALAEKAAAFDISSEALIARLSSLLGEGEGEDEGDGWSDSDWS